MAWPTLVQLKGQLGVDNTSQDLTLQTALDAAIEQVKSDTSDPDEWDEDFPDGPTASLSLAALILAVAGAKAPDAPHGIAAVFDLGALKVAAEHPTYLKMLSGHRHTFPLG